MRARMQVDERLGMALGVHAHEGGKLQEAGIDPSPSALEPRGHDSDQIVAKPRERFLVGELIDLVGRDAHVDRPRHQRQARRLDFGPVHRQHRGRGERRDAGLAHRDDVAILADMVDEVDDVLGIVLEAEPALFELYVARIQPVGDEHLMVSQHCADRAAQKRGEVAGHRRDEQHLGIGRAALLLKVKQIAERRRAAPLALRRREPRRAPRSLLCR